MKQKIHWTKSGGKEKEIELLIWEYPKQIL